MAIPQSVSELYPPKWVRAEDLAGRAVAVKIAAVTVEEFRLPDGSKKQSAVLAFEGKTRRLICNKTMCIQLAHVTGSERFADWVGQAVRLVPTTAPNGRPTIAIQAAINGKGT